MIELTRMDGTSFSLNEQLIETIENIPETKVALTSGRYYLVEESREEITQKIIQFKGHVLAPVMKLLGKPEEE